MVFYFDVVVIGAGHAGCEAGHAAAMLSASTCIITLDIDKIAQMSCNPAIGGIAKGQIVREVDALGGMMGKVADMASIQFRMLNRSKGPAMWSPRAQCDKHKYRQEWTRILQHTKNLQLWQDEVTEIIVEDQSIKGVKTILGNTFYAKSVILTAGTFLNGMIHIGNHQIPGGRLSEPAATKLTDSITRWGIRHNRLKTGTPVRIDKRSVHLQEMETQPGDKDFHQFSFLHKHRKLKQLVCWTTNTTKEAHDIIQKNLSNSPLFNGQIKSIGPRYCPSIETKIAIFPDKNSHPLFLEPEGINTIELYLNGFSSSLPLETQMKALKAIPPFRDVHIYRPGYAIEYDFFDPTQLHHTLESKKIKHFFFAGQVNGTTGYEEAAGQGLIAGINAVLSIRGENPFILQRDEAYIGVLIDDLVTKGVDEPYRMFTSRAEYRLLLSQESADRRLTPKGHMLGLIGNKDFRRFEVKQSLITELIDFLKSTSIEKKLINPFLEQNGSTPVRGRAKLSEILIRSEIYFEKLINSIACVQQELSKMESTMQRFKLNQEEIVEAVEIAIKYEGYIQREKELAKKSKRLEEIKLSDNFDYNSLLQLSTEARQKLSRIKPKNIGQASRIPGVSPNDISVLLIALRR